MNDNPLFDTLWMTGLFTGVVAVMPQLWLIIKTGGRAEAMTSHYVAAMALSRILSGIFMWEAREDITSKPWIEGFQHGIVATADDLASLVDGSVASFHVAIQNVSMQEVIMLFIGVSVGGVVKNKKFSMRKLSQAWAMASRWKTKALELVKAAAVWRWTRDDADGINLEYNGTLCLRTPGGYLSLEVYDGMDAEAFLTAVSNITGIDLEEVYVVTDHGVVRPSSGQDMFLRAGMAEVRDRLCVAGTRPPPSPTGTIEVEYLWRAVQEAVDPDEVAHGDFVQHIDQMARVAQDLNGDWWWTLDSVEHQAQEAARMLREYLDSYNERKEVERRYWLWRIYLELRKIRDMSRGRAAEQQSFYRPARETQVASSGAPAKGESQKEEGRTF